MERVISIFLLLLKNKRSSMVESRSSFNAMDFKVPKFLRYGGWSFFQFLNIFLYKYNWICVHCIK
jgi:hypothetical protein